LTLIMQNKANFKKDRMSVSYYLKKDCENQPRLYRLGKQSQSFDPAQDGTKPILDERRQNTDDGSLSKGRASGAGNESKL